MIRPFQTIGCPGGELQPGVSYSDEKREKPTHPQDKREKFVNETPSTDSTEKTKCFRVGGYHIATMRADRKKQQTISVKLFEGVPGEFTFAGLIVFQRKDLPDDCIRDYDGSEVIVMHALLTDFERLMDLVKGEHPVAMEFENKHEVGGRAYLKSLAFVFPGRNAQKTAVHPCDEDCGC